MGKRVDSVCIDSREASGLRVRVPESPLFTEADAHPATLVMLSPAC
jgi:hypothetical protein